MSSFIEDNALRRQKETTIHLKDAGNILSDIRLAAIRESNQTSETALPQLSEDDNGYNWLQLGPTCIPSGQTSTYNRVLVSGRITSIVVHPKNPDILYVSAAQGGVWKTTDGGRNWQATCDDQYSLAIGALAIDPQDCYASDILYAGTGEGNLMGANNPTSYYGCGILKTQDGGDNWKIVPEKENPKENPFLGSRFFRISVNPKQKDIIFIATSFGVYRTKDKGSTWTHMTNGLPNKEDMNAATDIVIDPNDTKIVYAGFWGKGIYKTENANDGNPIWNLLENDSNFPPNKVGRIVFDVYKTKSGLTGIYAFMTNTLGNSNSGIEYYFYESTNGGSTWTNINLPAADTQIRSLGRQGNYNLIIAVDYNDPNTVYLGATTLLKAIKNPRTKKWRFIDIGYNIHDDHHAFAFHPTDNNTIFVGSDGGIYKSNDGGATWEDTLNEGLCIAQFESMDQHPTSDAILIAGTQDNGTLQFRNNSVFYLCAENDGGFCAIDIKNANTVYHTHSGCTPFRSDEGGEFGEYKNGGSWISLVKDDNDIDHGMDLLYYKNDDKKLFFPPFGT